MGRRVRSGAAVALALALAAGVAACGDDDSTDTSGTEPTEEPGTSEVSALSITERDYEFELDGELTAGRVSITVTNEGAEFHELAMARLTDGKTLEDFRAALAESSEEDDDETFGGVVEADSTIDDLGGVQLPGTSYTITGDGVDAGRYVLLCYIPNAEGTSHYELGMLTEFTVAVGQATDDAEADVTYTATDDALDGPTELPAGETAIEVVNDSGAEREINVLKLKDGATIEEVGAWFESGGEGAPDPATAPIDFLAFVFDAEQDRTLTIDLTPGTWVITSGDPEQPYEGPPTEDPHAVVITVT